MKNLLIKFLLLIFFQLYSFWIFAQTSGPSTPEVQRFTASSTDNLVNLFTGDFQYTIPIMDVGGYPINISYSSNLSMNQEAGVVGLGWTFNPGVINRNVRGIPDDFKEDIISRTYKTEPSITRSFSFGTDVQLFSLAGLVPQMATFSYNNYRGYDLSLSRSLSANFSNFRLGIASNSGSNGSSISPSISYTSKIEGDKLGSEELSLSANFSTLEGLKSASFSRSLSNYTDENSTDKEIRQTAQSSTQYTFPFGRVRQSFTPKIESSTKSTSANVGLRIGLAAFGISGGADLNGLIGRESISNQIESKHSFGYIFSDLAGENDLMDKSNEKERAIFEKGNNLFLTYLEPDIFSVSGEGVNGSFRAFKSKIINVHNPKVTTEATSTDVGFEGHLAFGDHIGVNANATFATSETKAFSNLPDNRDEDIYFKNIGELNTLKSTPAFNATGGFAPKNIELETNNIAGSGLTIQDIIKLKENTNTQFSYLSAYDAQKVGLIKSIQDYSSPSLENSVNYSRFSNDGYRKAHHLSEIIVTTDEGIRYVYGLPAYNIVQREYSFNVNDNGDHQYTNEIDYENNDATVANQKGVSKMFSMTETPAFVYAYHLTAILSPDFVDLTGNGPTSDDFGTYTRFNYALSSTNFAWRTPHQSNKANYNSGYLSDDKDATANYVYGEKEIWNLHSIESRNSVARFQYVEREDGHESNHEKPASASTQKLKALSKISLFAKSEYISATAPTPIKEVFFEYDYSLCVGIPANHSNKGKLTLKKLKYSYGTSQKGKNSYYSFGYGDNTTENNPPFNTSKTDRWGNYRSTDYLGMPQKRAPYTDQNKDGADMDASAWELKEIKLPTGGKIVVDYEADDYSFVQDKPVMSMYKILGFSDNNQLPTSIRQPVDFPPISTLYSTNSNKYLFVEIPDDTNLSSYFSNLNQLYVNTLVELKDSKYEEIKTFIELKKEGTWYGITNISNIAWIDISDRRFENINPISFDAWQKLSHERRNLLYPPIQSSDYDSDDLGDMENETENILSGSLIEDFVVLFQRFETTMMGESYGKNIDCSQSFVRLNNPSLKKIGGGARVKGLKIFDNWSYMTNGLSTESFYEKHFDYTLNNGSISSGVASYEPMVGGDENPFVIKEGEFTLSTELDDLIGTVNRLSNERKYYIGPFGESMMPNPSVGYSKVTVKNIVPSQVTKHRSGKTEYEFYTAKDFPTILLRTTIDKSNNKSDPIIDAAASIFLPYSKTHNHLNVSQGFYIELNDMHGKQKSVKIFGENNPDKQISGNSYYYLTNPENNKQLSNIAKTVDYSTTSISDDLVGVDYDFFVEMLQSKSKSSEPGLQFNSEGIWVPAPIPFYLPAPIPIPSYRVDENILKLKTATKVVYRTGIIKEVITYSEGAEFSEKNILFDGQTGQTIIKESQNEYKEPYYSTSIPSYWYYKGMGQSSQNEGKIFSATISPSFELPSSINVILNGGEELLINELPQSKAWILKKPNNQFTIIDEKGENIPVGPYTVKIIRSGFRNMQSLPIQNVVTKTNPISGNSLLFAKVIDATATEFDDKWQTYLAFHPTLPKVTCECENREPLDIRTCGENLSFPEFSLPGNNLVDIFAGGNERAILNSRIDGKIIYVSIVDDKNFPLCDIKIKLGNSLPDSITYFCLSKAYPQTNRNKTDCGNSNIFYGKLEYRTNKSDGNMGYELESSCILSSECKLKTEIVEDPINCNILGSQKVVNPYILGLLGNWRPKSTFKFVTDRTYLPNAPLKDKGTYSCFKNKFNSNIPILRNTISTCTGSWQRAELNAIIDPFGKSIESLDALQRPTSQIFGYGHQLPLITAINAHYYQVGFDGFEDRNFSNQINSPFNDCIVEPTWQFESNSLTLLPVREATSSIAENYISAYASHTGRRSIRVSTPFRIQKTILPTCNIPFITPLQTHSKYVLNDCDLIKSFTPLKNISNTTNTQIFKVSAWVKENIDIDNLDAVSSSISVSTQGPTPRNATFKAQGPIIDGWRQINGQFLVSGNENNIQVILNPAATGKTYFDDIRVFPFNASVKTHVFDPFNLRLMAELDENNFASFYEYNEEGILVRTKKETERGIFTIQEIRSAKVKTNN